MAWLTVVRLHCRAFWCCLPNSAQLHCALPSSSPLPQQEMNLRDLTKKYGRNKGIDIKAVQLFTSQLMIALRHCKKNRVLHADIKPDNILINHRHNKVRGAC